jgi:hypothetical protein
MIAPSSFSTSRTPNAKRSFFDTRSKIAVAVFYPQQAFESGAEL